ncbi:MAG: DNA polymerase III subunit delta' [Rhodobacteraceae bacterium]|jgi:DNA polymerase-3 subunit delta'|nr:DNA polymerase III subunit delta' [Paracoccaceae bacterium]
MSDPADLPEPDRVDGAPHPRDTLRLFGQGAAEAAFLSAFTGGRLHHGWLVTGPRGVGKATFAWRAARFLLATPDTEPDSLFGAPPPPASLDVAPDHPVARRMAALSEPRLLLIRRGANDKGDRLMAQIGVDEVRKLRGFLGLSAADGGRRAVIVDAADEMNPSAANAILKVLEEPPPRTTLFLVSHQPAGLLPTIRSRCRTLPLSALAPADLSAALAQAGHDPGPDAARLAMLSAGSAGEAIRLLAADGLPLWDRLTRLIATAPGLDRSEAARLSDDIARGGDAAFDLMIRLTGLILSRLARTGAGLPPDAPEPWLARLSPGPQAARAWAEAEAALTSRARRGRAVNLDPAALVLDMLLKLNDTAAAHAVPQAAQ